MAAARGLRGGSVLKTNISVRLVLFTDHGIAGHRLERGAALPIRTFDFDDTKEGRRQATEAAELLQDYCDKHHAEPRNGRH